MNGELRRDEFVGVAETIGATHRLYGIETLRSPHSTAPSKLRCRPHSSTSDRPRARRCLRMRKSSAERKRCGPRRDRSGARVCEDRCS